MTTTNGTVAILAAKSAPLVLIGAMINADAVAAELSRVGRDVSLLCAGQRLDIALEDLLGCGALIARLQTLNALEFVNDSGLIAAQMYELHRDRLPEVFRLCRGARSELIHGLSADIDYCALADQLNVVGRFDHVCQSINRVC